MLSSLEHLLGWKLSKEKLNPFDFTPHPAGSSSLLGVIAGHRDGCETECPGKYVYDALSLIKQKSNEIKAQYDNGVSIPELVAVERKPSGETTITVSGGNEGEYRWFTSDSPADSIPGIHNSTFTTSVLTSSQTFYVALKIDACISPLLLIEVMGNEDRIAIYPNPTDGNLTISASSSFLPEQITVTNGLGQKVGQIIPVFKQKKATFSMTYLTPGMYILELSAASGTMKKRIIVR
jgi:hypothetical protein